MDFVWSYIVTVYYPYRAHLTFNGTNLTQIILGYFVCIEKLEKSRIPHDVRNEKRYPRSQTLDILLG